MPRSLLATMLMGAALALSPAGAYAQHVEVGPGGIGLHAEPGAHSTPIERHLVADEQHGEAHHETTHTTHEGGHGEAHHETTHTTHEGGHDGERH